jgi:hypothetical protein
LRGNVDGTNKWPAHDGDNANADNIHGGNGGANAGFTGFSAGNGGNGGDLGQNGQNGGDAFQHNYGLGGIAGDAIHGNALITWVNMGTVLGNII